MHTQHRSNRSERGFSLLEVMISVIIFSIGLIGVASLLMVSVRTNHSAYLRTQAGFLAETMADRMRANTAALWVNAYNDADYPVSGTVSDCSSGCSAADIATRDKIMWSNQLTEFLPAASASIACSRNSAVNVPAAAQANRAPYDGLCTMTLEWSETSLDKGSDAAKQTFAWVFQP